MARVAAALLLLAIGGRAAEAAVADRESAFIGYTEKKGAAAGCEDSRKECVGWAASGECTGNAGFMALSCKKSCGTCNASASSALLPPLPTGTPRDVVLFSSAHGNLAVLLRPDLSPNTAAYVRALAASGGSGCDACRFYRAEPVPEPGAIDNFGGPGPPYALLQGSLSSPGFKPIEREGAPLVGRGFACMIGTGPDFFFAIGPHPEWGAGHTVWGELEPASLATLDGFVNGSLALKKEVWGETHVTTLQVPVPFSLSLRGAPAAAGRRARSRRRARG